MIFHWEDFFPDLSVYVVCLRGWGLRFSGGFCFMCLCSYSRSKTYTYSHTQVGAMPHQCVFFYTSTVVSTAWAKSKVSQLFWPIIKTTHSHHSICSMSAHVALCDSISVLEIYILTQLGIITSQSPSKAWENPCSRITTSRVWASHILSTVLFNYKRPTWEFPYLNLLSGFLFPFQLHCASKS